MLRDIVLELGRVSEDTLEPGVGTGDSILHPFDFTGS
jgi:hypothetical protein